MGSASQPPLLPCEVEMKGKSPEIRTGEERQGPAGRGAEQGRRARAQGLLSSSPQSGPAAPLTLESGICLELQWWQLSFPRQSAGLDCPQARESGDR